MPQKAVRTLQLSYLQDSKNVTYDQEVDARYAVSINGSEPEIFSIHTGDFTAEWRWNVLRGYASRRVDISSLQTGKHSVTVSLLDPGIVLQEIRIN